MNTRDNLRVSVPQKHRRVQPRTPLSQSHWLWRILQIPLSISMLCVLVGGANAETVRVAGYVKAPYMMEVGEAREQTGLCVDILREALKRTGNDMTYTMLPNKRLIDAFQKNHIDAEPCVSPLWRRRDREISVYSDAYYQTENVVIIRKDRGFQATTIQDFRGKTLGTGLGYIYTDGFQEEFEAGKILRDDANSAEQSVRKLQSQRVDGIIIDRMTGQYWIRQLGFAPDAFEIAYVFKAKSELSVRLHISRQQLVPALNEALHAMEDDGTMMAIIQDSMQ